jgi:xanthine dehydrogenase accessory factor
MIRGELAELAGQLTDERQPFVVATAVRAAQPTSVRSGDTAIVRADGTIQGFVGGACAESSVRLHALRAMETGEPGLLRILPGDSPEAGDAREGEVTVNNPCLSGGTLEIFLEPRLPAPVLRVVGRSPIGRALADLGERAGYAVELEAADDSEPQVEDAAVVVASHGHDEERVLTVALREAVPYVGLIASAVRGEAVRGSLDLPAELRAQLRTPAGLEIGAETPEEIALSILAEIVAMRRSAPVGEPVPEPVPAPTAAVAVDPVCGMEVAVSPASIQIEVEGERHYFCREECRDRFAAEHARDASVR